ncbi:MAG: type II secretion system F family protein [Planctomycetota bacterium]|nr:type II secretion system F family protein [Planctomycetota bacterium]MDI6787918.1 type II secretion system F family protein [Planctomycetota bacterium]
MPLYNYKAKKGPKDLVDGLMEAESPQEVSAKLTSQGFFPVHIEQVGVVIDKKITVSSFFGTISSRDLNIFTYQLASLIKAGLPLLSGLYIIAEQTENKHLKAIISDIAQSVKHGEMLSTAMSRYPKIFPPLYTAMIKAGEDSGALDIILKRLAEHREKVEEIKSRVRSAMVYPIVLVLAGLGAVIFLMLAVIPQFKKVFTTIKVEPPLSTQILFAIGDGLSNYWYLFLGGIILLLIITKGVTFIQKKALDLFKLSLPFIGNFIRKSESAKLASSLSLLLTNGIPILASLEIVIPTLSNEVIKDALKKVANELRLGGTLSKGMQNSKHFFPFMTNMIKVGEEGGKLDEVLVEVSSFYEREINESIKIGLSLLEPAVLVGMAVVIGFIVLSMLLPIFQISVAAQ